MAKRGVKPFYTKAEDMQKLIDKFFAESAERDEPPTMLGLALALGFTDRDAILTYQGKKEFAGVIKKARAKVINLVEMRTLQGKGQVVGNIFWLKNNGNYRDAQQLDVTSNDQSLNSLLGKRK